MLQALTDTFGDECKCRFIAMSGLGGQLVVDGCRDAGFDAYLLKPFRSDDFKCALAAQAGEFCAVCGLGDLN